MSCPETTTLIDHVDGELTENQRRELSRHLEGCSACASVVDELTRLTTRLGPDDDEWANVDLVAPVSQRIDQLADPSATAARGPARQRARRRWLPYTLGGLATAAAAAVLLVLLLPALRQQTTAPPPPGKGGGAGGFAIRGGKDDAGAARKWVKLWIYRSTKRGYLPVRDRISRDARLVFGYRSAKAALQHLMIVAVAPDGRHYWYYPAVKGAARSGKSVAIRLGKHELPDEISHPLSAGALKLHALFSTRALTVAEVEAALSKQQKSASKAALALPDTIVLTRALKVGEQR